MKAPWDFKEEFLVLLLLLVILIPLGYFLLLVMGAIVVNWEVLTRLF